MQLRRYKAKRVKTRCLQKGVGHLEPRFHREVVVPCQHIDTTRKAIDCVTTLPLTVFGRPFVKRFALCYRSVVCPVVSVCLSVCPVCDVCALWQTVGRIKMKLGIQVGLGPGDIVLGGDRAPLP